VLRSSNNALKKKAAARNTRLRFGSTALLWGIGHLRWQEHQHYRDIVFFVMNHGRRRRRRPATTAYSS
jgi:hypothetical protein